MVIDGCKICFKCRESKPVCDFNKGGKRSDGYYSKCRVCDKIDRDEPEYKAKRIAYMKKLRTTPHDRLTAWFGSRRRSAIKKKIPFTIVIEDILPIPSHCPVLGIPLFRKTGQGNGGWDNSPSMDRVIPELGYIKGNVRVISKRANTLKNSGTADEHRRIADYIDANSLDIFSNR